MKQKQLLLNYRMIKFSKLNIATMNYIEIIKVIESVIFVQTFYLFIKKVMKENC